MICSTCDGTGQVLCPFCSGEVGCGYCEGSKLYECGYCRGFRTENIQQPIQPVIKNGNQKRFHPNAIVRHLLDSHQTEDMNSIGNGRFLREDREQFAQLIGYSVAGFGTLSYVSDYVYEKAENEDSSVLSSFIRELVSLVKSNCLEQFSVYKVHELLEEKITLQALKGVFHEAEVLGVFEFDTLSKEYSIKI